MVVEVVEKISKNSELELVCNNLLIVRSIDGKELMQVIGNETYFILNSEKEILRSEKGKEIANTRFCETFSFVSYSEVLNQPHLYHIYHKAICPIIKKLREVSN